MLSKFENKKGIAYHMILWIPKMVYFIIVFITIFGFILLFTKTEAYVGGVEARLLMHRLYFYPDYPGVFSKYDGTLNRAYLGKKGENFGKLYEDDTMLEKRLFLTEKNLPLKMAEFTLQDEELKLAQREAVLRNKELYDSWAPLARFVEEKEDLKGKGRIFVYRDYRTLSDGTVLKINLLNQDE